MPVFPRAPSTSQCELASLVDIQYYTILLWDLFLLAEQKKKKAHLTILCPSKKSEIVSLFLSVSLHLLPSLVLAACLLAESSPWPLRKQQSLECP